MARCFIRVLHPNESPPAPNSNMERSNFSNVDLESGPQLSPHNLLHPPHYADVPPKAAWYKRTYQSLKSKQTWKSFSIALLATSAILLLIVLPVVYVGRCKGGYWDCSVNGVPTTSGSLDAKVAANQENDMAALEDSFVKRRRSDVGSAVANSFDDAEARVERSPLGKRQAADFDDDLVPDYMDLNGDGLDDNLFPPMYDDVGLGDDVGPPNPIDFLKYLFGHCDDDLIPGDINGDYIPDVPGDFDGDGISDMLEPPFSALEAAGHSNTPAFKHHKRGGRYDDVYENDLQKDFCKEFLTKFEQNKGLDFSDDVILTMKNGDLYVADPALDHGWIIAQEELQHLGWYQQLLLKYSMDPRYNERSVRKRDIIKDGDMFDTDVVQSDFAHDFIARFEQESGKQFSDGVVVVEEDGKIYIAEPTQDQGEFLTMEELKQMGWFRELLEKYGGRIPMQRSVLRRAAKDEFDEFIVEVVRRLEKETGQDFSDHLTISRENGKLLSIEDEKSGYKITAEVLQTFDWYQELRERYSQIREGDFLEDVAAEFVKGTQIPAVASITMGGDILIKYRHQKLTMTLEMREKTTWYRDLVERYRREGRENEIPAELRCGALCRWLGDKGGRSKSVSGH